MLEKSIAAINKVQDLIKATLYAWALPFTCILCSQLSDREQDLCQACYQDLPIITQSCPRCANKIPFKPKDSAAPAKAACPPVVWASKAQEDGVRRAIAQTTGGQAALAGAATTDLSCGSCLQNPPPFSASFALFAYEAPVISLILDLKFKGQLAYARILGELMAEKIQQDGYRQRPLPDLLMPVPLHDQRLKERGFNQALELARPLAQILHIELDAQSARRIQNTPAQMNLPAERRRANVKNAFDLSVPLTGKTIAIIDDVMTTGSTAAEFSRALLRQGAAAVEVWCCARTVNPTPTYRFAHNLLESATLKI